jgi:chromosome partitioning protein
VLADGFIAAYRGEFTQMAKIVAVANQKGGVGKTTTAINLAACIALKGYKTLLIDSDPQGNASSGLGINRQRLKYCIYDLLINQVGVSEVIRRSRIENLDIIPATIQLAGAEVELAGREQREYYLKEALRPIYNEYDWILIDCPPSLGILTLNALNASQSVIIPLQCEYYALEGLSQLMNTISVVKKRMNRSLGIEGIVFTMFDARTNLSIQVVDQVKKHFKNQVYRTIVPRNVRLSEAPSHGQPIVIYDPRCKGAEVYQDLALEVLRRA